MGSFKSGSGDLDFGESEEDDSSGEEVDEPPEAEPGSDPTGTETASRRQSQSGPIEPDDQSKPPSRDARSTDKVSGPESSKPDYPYFVRRNNVGDERDTRLEIHVRDDVAEREAQFRNDLAELLGTNEVSKTDAREFALLAAYESPELVAELMQEEGFSHTH